MANTYESIDIGDSHEWTRVVTAEDVKMFAEITGDDNPVHVIPTTRKSIRDLSTPWTMGCSSWA